VGRLVSFASSKWDPLRLADPAAVVLAAINQNALGPAASFFATLAQLIPTRFHHGHRRRANREISL
jgi:hypothetical protein